jgi:hypothetical protein
VLVRGFEGLKNFYAVSMNISKHFCLKKLMNKSSCLALLRSTAAINTVIARMLVRICYAGLTFEKTERPKYRHDISDIERATTMYGVTK